MSARNRQDLEKVAVRLASWLAVELPSHAEDRAAFWRDARSTLRRANGVLVVEEVREVLAKEEAA